MTWQLLPARENFSAFAAEWDRLNAELYDSHPMFDSRFVGPLLEHFGDGTELLCFHRAGQTIDGALILRPLGYGRWALFLPAQMQAGAVMLRSARILESLFPALPGHAWSIDLLAIDPDYAPDWTGLALPRRVNPHALTMAVATGSSFDDYWKSRPKHLAQNLRRYRRRTEAQLCAPSISVISQPTEIAAAVDRYGILESAGWKGKAGTAVSANTPQGAFYRAMLEAFAQRGQAKVIELHISDKLAASRLVIRSRNMWMMLKTTYDETLAALSPGRQILLAALQHAFDKLKNGKVEFYTDVSRDNAEWATDLRYIHHVQLYRSPWSAGMHGWLQALKKPPPSSKTNQPNPYTISAARQIDELSPDQLAFMETAAKGNIESSADWFRNLQQTVFANDAGVCHFVAEFNGKPIALLPLRDYRDGAIRKIEALGNYYTSLYTPQLSGRATAWDLAALLQQANAGHGGAHVMRFAPLDPASPAYEALLTALRSIGWIPFRFFCFGNWHQPVTGSWQEYFNQREGQLRSTIKRKGKKFAAEGGTLEIVTEPNDVEAAIAAYNHVYALSWKKPEPYHEFIPGLIRWLANQGQLRLGIARLAGQPIAAQIWIVAHGKASIFKLAYDEAHAKHAAGTLLTAHLMEHVIDRDHVREVDYLIGDDEHKRAWMSQRRERWGIVAYNPKTIIGAILLIKEIAGRALRKATTMTCNEFKPAQDISWQLIPISQFGQHAARWDELQRSCANIPFFETLFLQPLLEEFGTGQEILALGISRNKLCAAAILTKRRMGVWQTFQPSQLPLGAWVSSPAIDIAASSNSLLRALPGLNLNLSLTQIDPLFHQRPADNPCARTMDYIDTAWVDIDQSFDAYWEARGKNLKTNMRKQRSKLQSENVALALDCITTPAGVAQAIENYGALESTGWKGKDGTAVHPDNAQGRFYRKMLENFCAQGRGRIYQYRFNDKVVAMDLCIETGDRIVILKTAYDEAYKSVSPSTLMRQDEFRELFNEGKLKRIEFYGKVMEWHSRWAEHSRTIYHLTTYRWPIIAYLHNLKNRNKRKETTKPDPSLR